MSTVPSALHKNPNSQSSAKGNGVSTASDDEVLTVQHGSVISDENTSDTATIFEAFKEVSLDLTLTFSTQNSPVASTVELPLSEHTSPLQAPSLCVPSSSASVEAAPSIRQLGRAMSFASQSPLSPLMKAKKKFSSTKFSSDQSSILRGSWPAIKYVGRGTPVDRNRRREWGGLSAESVGEDGLLFSDMRATSLDSRSPRLSSSSDWDFLNTGISTATSPGSGGHSIPVEEGEEQGGEDRVPPLQKIEIKIESEADDWASVMETVLSSAEKGREGATQSAEIERHADSKTVVDEQPKSEISERNVELIPDNVGNLQSEIHFDLNIDKALDLGFSPAVDGGTLFTLAAITDSDNSNLTIRRTTTTSSHSLYSTPSEGPSEDRPVANPAPESMTHGEEGHSSPRALAATRSTGSTKADLRVDISRSPKIDTVLPWWRKALGRLKRVQALLRSHRNSC